MKILSFVVDRRIILRQMARARSYGSAIKPKNFLPGSSSVTRIRKKGRQVATPIATGSILSLGVIFLDAKNNQHNMFSIKIIY